MPFAKQDLQFVALVAALIGGSVGVATLLNRADATPSDRRFGRPVSVSRSGDTLVFTNGDGVPLRRCRVSVGDTTRAEFPVVPAGTAVRVAVPRAARASVACDAPDGRVSWGG
jgi:hypothetical protein